MRVALTFDAEHPDQPGASRNADWILEYLDGRKATFFIQGCWAQAEPEIARRIATDGHVIGNHSHHHVPAHLLTAEGFHTDLLQAEASIREATGADPSPWYRFPNAFSSEASIEILKARGYEAVFWDLAVADWDATRGPEQVADDVVNQVRDGFIVLLHTWPTQTVEALPLILRRLEGATFVGIDELAHSYS